MSSCISRVLDIMFEGDSVSDRHTLFSAFRRGDCQVDEARDELAKLPTMSPGHRASATNLCYIIFTSGSTGRPKGTMLQHDSAINFLHGVNECACFSVPQSG